MRMHYAFGTKVVVATLLVGIGQCISTCPGYAASNVVDLGSSLTADLTLNGVACNTYGEDLRYLKLLVEYQTDTRLHIQIFDRDEQVYQVPNNLVGRPYGAPTSSKTASTIQFTCIAEPFSFAVTRKGTSEVLFNTTGSQLIFESQYVRLRTSLPKNPNLYGLGEHSDPFRLPTTDYTRTLWNHDASGVPAGENLYGSFPIYLDHRNDGKTHGVYLLNSNGMDIKINQTAENEQYLEYNTLGGILDLYLVAGPGPIDVARQFNDVFATPNQMPYWSLGYHQCRYGMRDVYEVAEIVANYSAADIPLETMWTDIDYMDRGKVFSLDPERYPLAKVRELVRTLHDRGQRYVMVVDPAVAYQNYPPFDHGVERDIFLKTSDNSVYKGVVWPGVSAFPDWFKRDAEYWFRDEFVAFFDPDNGVDIDAVGIDMDEASNFCPYPCDDPAGYARAGNFPPTPPSVRQNAPRPIPGFPSDFQPPDVLLQLPKRDSGSNVDKMSLANRSVRSPQSQGIDDAGPSSQREKQADNGDKTGLPNRNLINPPYRIHNAASSLSDQTLDTSLVHHGGFSEYDTHNLYGFLIGWIAGGALQRRRPTERPMVIARSTFPTSFAGHWLGDNRATWDAYRTSIAQQLAFVSIFHIPMVGANVCGYALETTENLCARWAMLGAFSSLYHNNAMRGKSPQEFYRWPTVAQAAKNAIDIRYRLLDYLYTAMIWQRRDGTPWLDPLWFFYPEDTKTFGIDLQFFFGPCLLVSPVIEEDATSVSVYLPDDIFYDWYTHRVVRGRGANVILNDVGFTSIPLHIKGGSIIPLRVESANTTKILRTKDFRVLVAPGLDGTAEGRLYLDDGISIVVADATTEIEFAFDSRSISMTVLKSGYDVGVRITEFVILGQRQRAANYSVNGVPVEPKQHSFNQTSRVLKIKTNATLLSNLNVSIA